ncbi:phenylalanyl-tRNA synthetase beta chain [Methanohalophilus levihalophilus]|uniref:phenylalanine--tRNA ligase subunit beta n=1 Tax=Methanohalophilus levihalophilus TaxID=1431282 RepID=UPI001AE4CA07|nr:phenylalanine--tRNA ligase subunit beta [Methanohalophilus levihalophilus]MBP2029729.1 phenylalanyl-tRNA synthetase beta chain [Methanohalophilus levihalophilus]
MPIITLDYNDLEELTGSDRDTIIDRVPMIGADIERKEESSIDIEFFPDRPDLYSVEGVARAMRGFMDIEPGLPEYTTKESGVEITLDKKIADIRPVLGCAIVRGINFTSSSIKSLMDLQESLHWGLGRDRKKVSIGVHDLANIKPPFRYMAADPEFEFVPLGFTEPMSMREILEKHPKGVRFANLLEGFDYYPLIKDANDNVLSFPPIINGTLTMVEESTTDLFIDVTGLSKEVYTALNIVVSALAERGARIETVKVISPDGSTQVTPDLSPTVRHLTRDDIESLIGVEMPVDQIVACLEKMRLGAKDAGNGNIEIQVPSFRADILHSYDLIEDIAIGIGYDNIEPVPPKNAAVGAAHPLSLLGTRMREIMVGLGYMEVMPFTLTSERVHFDWMRRPEQEGITKVLKPISEDQTLVRPTILPNLMEILSLNQHHELPQRLFEVGEVVEDCRNRVHLAAISIHSQANFEEVRELVDAVMREKCVEYTTAKSDDPAFIPGRAADIFVDGVQVGVMGEFHPEVLTNFGMGHATVGFEMDITPK